MPVPSAGFEPAHTAPEADALSPELRGQGKQGSADQAHRRTRCVLVIRQCRPQPVRVVTRAIGTIGCLAPRTKSLVDHDP
jgi:hypothetical protein